MTAFERVGTGAASAAAIAGLSFWDDDESTRWLAPVDVIIARCIRDRIREHGDGTCSILEVGVWRGAWMAQMVDVPWARAAGIDPYPDAADVREDALARWAAKGFDERIGLFPDRQSLLQGLGEACRFDLAHVDGEHSQAAAGVDLDFAAEHLAADGVVIVDDYRHPHFPGVAAAMYDFLAKGDFAILLVSETKAYLCRSAHHEAWLQAVGLELLRLGISCVSYYGEGQPLGYVQLPDVFGRPMLLAVDPEDNLRLRRALCGAERRRTASGARAREVAARWLPPALQDAMRRRRPR